MTLRVRDLGPRDGVALEGLLARGGAADVWLRHALRTGGHRGFVGVFDARATLCGAALLRAGALCAARCTSDAAADALLPHLRRRGPWFSTVGPEGPCGRLVAGLAGGAPLRVNRVQVFMCVADVERLGAPSRRLQVAVPGDLAALLPMVADYRREDGLTARDEDPTTWLRTHLSERIERGDVYVVRDDRGIVFTGAFNFRGVDGAGLGGIYTLPACRGAGLAARATASLCRIGLARGPLVTLHVDARNAAALRCYEKAGLVREGEFRLTFR